MFSRVKQCQTLHSTVIFYYLPLSTESQDPIGINLFNFNYPNENTTKGNGQSIIPYGSGRVNWSKIIVQILNCSQLRTANQPDESPAHIPWLHPNKSKACCHKNAKNPSKSSFQNKNKQEKSAMNSDTA